MEGKETAILGGGCFWCLEAVFELLKGVEKVESGYSGGLVEEPSYQEVCRGTTGHAEVVRLTFDPQVISFEEILEVFFTVHDPTTLNRQGADVGPQYRSAIFYADRDQRKAAEKFIENLGKAKTYPRPIVTEVTELDAFYQAEEYHQDFMARNPTYPYIVYWDAPKIEHLKLAFPELLKADVDRTE